MARIKGATMTHKRRKKMLKLAKGFYGSKSKHFKMAKQQVMKSGNYALAGRRMKKRQFRNLWICRIRQLCRSGRERQERLINPEPKTPARIRGRRFCMC